MSLDDLTEEVEEAYADLDEEVSVALDRETRHELAMLSAALDAEPADLINRAVHTLYQATVDTAKLDFHLRSEYGLTYDEYLSGMTYEEMTGAAEYPQFDDDERRYQF